MKKCIGRIAALMVWALLVGTFIAMIGPYIPSEEHVFTYWVALKGIIMLTLVMAIGYNAGKEAGEEKA